MTRKKRYPVQSQTLFSEKNSDTYAGSHASYKKSPSFNWSFVHLVLLVVLFGMILNERIWSKEYASLVDHSLDQVSSLSNENSMLYSHVANTLQRERFELLGYQAPEREYILEPSVTLR